MSELSYLIQRLHEEIGQRGRSARPVNSWMVEKAFILVSA